MTEKNLIRVYTGATSEKRIDIIIKIIQIHWHRGRIYRRAALHDRMWKGKQPPTVSWRSWSKSPDRRNDQWSHCKKSNQQCYHKGSTAQLWFSGNVLDGVDQTEVYIRDAYILRDMRKDYNLFNSQLGILGTERRHLPSICWKKRQFRILQRIRELPMNQRDSRYRNKSPYEKQVKRFMDGQPGGIA